MELPVLNFEIVQSFMVCMARVAALLGTLPIIGTGNAPPQVKVMFAFLFSLLLFPVVSPLYSLPDYSAISLATLVLTEAALGIMMGFLVQLIFAAVQMGGTVIGYQMGFAAANVFDPANNTQVSLLAQFNNVIAVLLFFAFNVHHLFFRVLVESFKQLPPGQVNVMGNAGLYLMEMTSHAFELAIKLAAPILALLILSNLTLGIMARIFPQLNAFILSFPINIGVSFIVLGLTLSLFVALLSQEYQALEARFLQLFQTLR